jgi:hypothetical protein
MFIVRRTGIGVLFSGKESPMSDFEILTIVLMVLGLVITAGDNQKRK